MDGKQGRSGAKVWIASDPVTRPTSGTTHVSERRPAVTQPMRRHLIRSDMPPDQAPAITIFDFEPGHFCCAHYRNLSFLLWQEPATVEALTRVAKLTAQLARVYPQGHSSVVFIRTGIPMPDERARTLMARAYDARESQLKCMSVIAEGEAFWVSSVRSTVTQLSQAKGGTESKVRVRIDTSIDEASRWFPLAHGEATLLTVTPRQFQALSRGALKALRSAVLSENPFNE